MMTPSSCRVREVICGHVICFGFDQSQASIQVTWLVLTNHRPVFMSGVWWRDHWSWLGPGQRRHVQSLSGAGLSMKRERTKHGVWSSHAERGVGACLHLAKLALSSSGPRSSPKCIFNEVHFKMCKRGEVVYRWDQGTAARIIRGSLNFPWYCWF